MGGLHGSLLGRPEAPQLTAQAAQTVGQDWQWPPFTAQVYTDYANEVTKVQAGSETMVQAMANLQTLETSTRRTRATPSSPRKRRHAG